VRTCDGVPAFGQQLFRHLGYLYIVPHGTDVQGARAFRRRGCRGLPQSFRRPGTEREGLICEDRRMVLYLPMRS
jgi:hypothetical protein